MAQQQSEIRYLTPPSVDVKKKKYSGTHAAGPGEVNRFLSAD